MNRTITESKTMSSQSLTRIDSGAFPAPGHERFAPVAAVVTEGIRRLQPANHPRRARRPALRRPRQRTVRISFGL